MIRSVSHLEFILKKDKTFLTQLGKNIEKYYYEKREPKFDAKGFPRLQNGIQEERIMHPSKGILKSIQTRIKNEIFNSIPFPKYMQGGIKKRDNVTNAKVHLGKHYKFTTDIKTFFPSISSRRVYNSLVEAGFSADVSHILTRLTTYKGFLPQGTPTSTHLANLAFLKTANKLSLFCAENKITHTIYVDDITLSSQFDFKEQCPKIINIILSSKFRINSKKTYYIAGSAIITGIWTKQNSLGASNKVINKMLRSDSVEVKTGYKNYLKKIKSHNS